MFVHRRIVTALAITGVLGIAGGVPIATVLGQQDPSPAASGSPDPMAPSFFTGNAPLTGSCQLATPTVEVVDGVERRRGESWGCLTWTTDDPRFSGTSRNIWHMDAYTDAGRTATGRVGTIIAGRERLENEAGAWVGTWTTLDDNVAGWFIGEGAYEGLAAYVIITDAEGSAEVLGYISPTGVLEPPAELPDE